MKYLLLILLLMGSVGATTIKLSNTSSDYELDIYTMQGQYIGTANTTNNVTISRNDYRFQLRYPKQNLINRPFDFFKWFPTVIFTLFMLLLIAIVGLSLTGVITRPLR